MDVTTNVQRPIGEKGVLFVASVNCEYIWEHKLPSVTVLGVHTLQM